MSSDITRDDLRVVNGIRLHRSHPLPTRKVTDEEFDRLVGERAEHLGWLSPEWNKRWKVLRALLTDECDVCDDGLMCYGNPRHNHDDGCRCPGCGGRGWLPKDGVILFDVGEIFGVPFDWLEAEDA